MLDSPEAKKHWCFSEVVDFNKLLASDKPHYLISDELWDQWIKSIQESKVRFTKIIDIAASLNLHWPETKRYQDVSCYLNWRLLDLFEISDLEIKKTLFLCIAEAAIKRAKVIENNVEIPVTSNSVAVYIGNEIVQECFKTDCYPDVCKTILPVSGRSKENDPLQPPDSDNIAISLTPSEINNKEPDAEKLFKEGVGIISIARKTGKPALSIFRNLVHLKLVRHRTGSGYNLSKLPFVLRDRLKNDGVNFGIWCSSLNISPAILEKGIICLMSGEYIPENARTGITMLKKEYPDIFDQISHQNVKLTYDTEGYDTDQNHNCTKENYDNKTSEESTERFIRQLEVSIKPEYLITDDLWYYWSQVLVSHPVASQSIISVARKKGLIWPITKDNECFDKYLGLPFKKIKQILGWETKRTLILCVAHLALKILSETEFYITCNEVCKSEVTAKVNCEISFDDIFNSDNPIGLLSVELWDEWRSLLETDNARNRYVSDIVDELGSLYWQARWKNEKISEYLHFSLDDISGIQWPGKGRTILICIAKLATNTLAKLNYSSIDTYDETIQRIPGKAAEVIASNPAEYGTPALLVETYTHPANVVSAKPPKPMLNQVSVVQLTDVLSSHFANGFRLNSPIEMARFRSLVEKDVGKKLTLSDEELKSCIAACGTTFDGKIYAVSAQAKERIKRQAEGYFSDGAQAIFFAEFYAKNESWLFEASVVSEEMLIEVLRRLFPKLSFTQTYFGYTDASIFAALESEILRVWGDDVLRTYGQLAERLRYIPLERIKSALGQNGNFIWNSVETFSHVSRIEITNEERQVIREAALRGCNSQGYASIADLPFGEIEERNYGLSFTAVHNAVYRICLSDKFDIKGKIVTRKGDTLDALTIMKNYCRTIEKCSLYDLLNYEKELTGEVHRWIPMEAGNTVLVRIDKDTYVADKFVHFDAETVDAAIELFIEGDYLPLISFTTFGAFPHCGQAWNLFLLESYCRRFSRKFRFDTPSVNSRNAGAVIRNNCGMDYTGIMTDAVANADIPLKDTAVGTFLYESGFTGRRTTAKVNEIIDKAKAIRKRKD